MGYNRGVSSDVTQALSELTRRFNALYPIVADAEGDFAARQLAAVADLGQGRLFVITELLARGEDGPAAILTRTLFEWAALAVYLATDEPERRNERARKFDDYQKIQAEHAVEIVARRPANPELIYSFLKIIARYEETFHEEARKPGRSTPFSYALFTHRGRSWFHGFLRAVTGLRPSPGLRALAPRCADLPARHARGVGQRDITVHAGIDWQIVWRTVTLDLPALRPKIEALLET